MNLIEHRSTLFAALGLRPTQVALVCILTVISSIGVVTAAAARDKPEERTILNQKSHSFVVDQMSGILGPSEQSIALNRILGIDQSLAMTRVRYNNRLVLINPHRVLFDQFGFIDTGEFLATTLRVHGGHEAVVSATSVHVSEQGYVALTTPGVTTEAVVVAGISTSPSDAEQKILFDFMSDGLIRYAIGESELGQFTGVNGKALAKASSEEESHEGVPGQMLVNARSADDIQRSVMNIGNVPRARRLVVENGSISLEGESPLQAMRKAVSEPLSNKNLTSERVRQPPQNEPPLAKASAAVVKPVPFNSKQNTVPAADNKNRSVSADPLPSNYVHNRTPAPAKRAPSSQPQLQRAGQAKGKSPSHGKRAQKASPLTQAHQPQSPPWNSMPSGLPEWIKYLPKSESITDTPAMSRP